MLAQHPPEVVPRRRLLSIAECQQRLGTKKSTTYDAIRKLPAGARVKIGRLVRVDADALEAWIAAGGDLADTGTE